MWSPTVKGCNPGMPQSNPHVTPVIAATPERKRQRLGYGGGLGTGSVRLGSCKRPTAAWQAPGMPSAPHQPSGCQMCPSQHTRPCPLSDSTDQRPFDFGSCRSLPPLTMLALSRLLEKKTSGPRENEEIMFGISKSALLRLCLAQR